MNPILVVRSEIICLIILLFIMLYSNLYKMGKDQGTFLRICIFAIGHVTFDLITVLTVNSLGADSLFNRVCHIIFYIFALLYSCELLCYAVSLCYSKKTQRNTRIISLSAIALYLAISPFLPMEYLQGKGTKYSFGTAAITGYGVAMVLFVASIIVVLINRKKMDKYVVGALLPMLGASILAEVIQILVPELLFTGGAVTIITVGFFFSLENPVVVLRHKVQIDAMTGVKSRHSYEADIVEMEREFATGTQYGMVFCDINDLKKVNDTGGHLEGDAYISSVAQILIRCLGQAEKIYRMGGDEFLAVYQSKSIDVIRREVNDVYDACEKESEGKAYPVSLAIGYALSDGDYKSLRDVLRMADYQMYTHKAKIKRQRAYLLGDSEKINIAGLTDRIFDAFASTDVNRFLFVTNMMTNVTRMSLSGVEYFGMKSEFIPDFTHVLMERLHPDDRDAFFDDISAVMSGTRKFHDLECRIRNSGGDYVTCTSNGTVLDGKSGDPDLFAGSIYINSASESIDRLTHLRNGYGMMYDFSQLISSHSTAALLKLSILNLSRINMLYGYTCGNDVLAQFAAETRAIVGREGSVFRSDGTKFVVCLPDAGQEKLEQIYRKIRTVAEQRIHLDALTPPLQLAAGAYLLRSDFAGTSSILRSNLIYAHDQSKYEKHGRLVYYDSRTDASRNSDHKDLLLRIHQDAIAGRVGFYLVYQSIVNAKTGKIVGAEALLRWKDEESGVIRPDAFIPWLESDPCFFGLGNWILRNALEDAKRILPYIPNFIVNINIAMPQLEHEGFRSAILDLLEETGFPPAQLCLELTERCRELNVDFLKGEIEFFRSHSIRVALDDLGTGFSSFGLLLSLNVDEVKLDRSFVKEVRTQRVNQILIRMLIDASTSIGYNTCLEGVEDASLCQYLESYGATYYQGYYCDRPTCIDEFITHMNQWNDSANT